MPLVNPWPPLAMPLPCPWVDPVGSALTPEEFGQQSHLGNMRRDSSSKLPSSAFWACVSSCRAACRATTLAVRPVVVRQLEAYWTKDGKAGNSLDEVPASRVTEFDKAAELERQLLSSCSTRVGNRGPIPSGQNRIRPALCGVIPEAMGPESADGGSFPTICTPRRRLTKRGGVLHLCVERKILQGTGLMSIQR